MKETAHNVEIETQKHFLNFSQVRKWPEFGVIFAFLILFIIFSIFSSKIFLPYVILQEYLLSFRNWELWLSV